MIKNIAYTVFATWLAFAIVPLAHADDSVTSANSNTGDSSTAINTTSISHSTVITTQQHASSTSTVNLAISTDNNTVASNTRVGDFSTGGATAIFAVNHTLNNNPIGSIPGDGSTTISSRNTNTGSGSTTSNRTTITNGSSLSQSQSAQEHNTITLALNEGDNNFSHNTHLGNISFGPFNLSVAINGSLNSSPNAPPVTAPVIRPPEIGDGLGAGSENPLLVAAVTAPQLFPTGGTLVPLLLIISTLIGVGILLDRSKFSTAGTTLNFRSGRPITDGWLRPQNRSMKSSPYLKRDRKHN